MNQSDFFNLVIAEAKALKENATAEELKLCVPEKLDPTRAKTCIYGLMTGHCDSARAIHLLSTCAIPVSDNFSDLRPVRRNKSFGKFNNYGFDTEAFDNFSQREVFSPIEFYITNAHDDGESIAAFLNGRKEDLTVKDLSMVEDFSEYVF